MFVPLAKIGNAIGHYLFSSTLRRPTQMIICIRLAGKKICVSVFLGAMEVGCYVCLSELAFTRVYLLKRVRNSRSRGRKKFSFVRMRPRNRKKCLSKVLPPESIKKNWILSRKRAEAVAVANKQQKTEHKQKLRIPIRGMSHQRPH